MRWIFFIVVLIILGNLIITENALDSGLAIIIVFIVCWLKCQLQTMRADMLETKVHELEKRIDKAKSLLNEK